MGRRVGFALGGLLGLYALVLRRSARESHILEHRGDAGSAPLAARRTPIIVCDIVFISAVVNAAYYTWVTFAASIVIARGMDPKGAYVAALLAQVACLAWLPVSGMLADRLGRRFKVVAFGPGVMAIAYPVSWLVTEAPWTLFRARLICLFVWGILAAMFPALVSEQVPTHLRPTSVGWVWYLTSSMPASRDHTPIRRQLPDDRDGWVRSRFAVVREAERADTLFPTACD